MFGLTQNYLSIFAKFSFLITLLGLFEVNANDVPRRYCGLKFMKKLTDLCTPDGYTTPCTHRPDPDDEVVQKRDVGSCEFLINFEICLKIKNDNFWLLIKNL